MKNVIIKQTVLGQGMPKICAPLVEKDYKSLIHQAESFTEQPVDVAEWRADWFDSILEPDILDQVLPGLESALKDIPLLFTFRTQREGGHVSAPLPAYRSLVEQAIRSGHVHLVDLELLSGDDMYVRQWNWPTDTRYASSCPIMILRPLQKRMIFSAACITWRNWGQT